MNDSFVTCCGGFSIKVHVASDFETSHPCLLPAPNPICIFTCSPLAHGLSAQLIASDPHMGWKRMMGKKVTSQVFATHKDHRHGAKQTQQATQAS